MDLLFILTVFRVAFALVALVAGFLAFSAWREWKLTTRLRESGLTTEGEIVDRREVNRRNFVSGVRFTHYYGRFRFSHQGQSYEVEQRVGRKTHNMLRPGTRVPVRYLPGAPHRARLDGTYTDYTRRTAQTLSATAGVVLVAVLMVVLAPTIF